jgi:hypothetical protein
MSSPPLHRAHLSLLKLASLLSRLSFYNSFFAPAHLVQDDVGGVRTIRHAIEQLSAKGSVRKAGDEFVVGAKRLHKSLLIWQGNRCPCSF